MSNAMPSNTVTVTNPLTGAAEDISLSDKSHLALAKRIAEALEIYRLKEGFCDGAPPSREALQAHPEVFKSLERKPWKDMTAVEGPLLIEVAEFLSDKEFLSAFAPSVEFLLRADRWTPYVQLFLVHLRAMSKGQVHRALPYDFFPLLMDSLDALDEKYGVDLVKRQETTSFLKKTREWARMRISAKR
jgi:hypothetical protein